MLGWQASHLTLDAGLEKQIPLQHPYIQIYKPVRKVELDRVAAGIAALPPQGPLYVAVESETSNLEVGTFSDVIVAAGAVVTVGDAGVRRWETALR